MWIDYKYLTISIPQLGFQYDPDYLGMYGIHDAGLIGVYKCRLRILDSFGTEPQCEYDE